MRILISARHRKSLEPYLGLVREASRRGHAMIVTLQERDEKVGRLLDGIGGVTIAEFPHQRRDEWRDASVALRASRDYLQYLLPPYARARKLRARALQRLFDRLGIELEVRDATTADAGLRVPGTVVSRLAGIAETLERTIPADQPHRAFLERQRPDVVLVSPLVHFGSAQAEVVKAAQSLDIPVAMHVFSWDNLSTKGALHVSPDRVFAWNETQRRELADLHGYPADRVDLVGAPRFDEFAAMPSCVSRDTFMQSMGFDAAAPTLLYLCSSRLVSEREARFVRGWIRAVRAADGLGHANLLIRPHPDVPDLEPRWITRERQVQWSEAGNVSLEVCELFDDPRTVLARSDRGSARTLLEMLTHVDAVMGLNTSAEIEAGIVGRPVLTVIADETIADGQQTTLHFHYLRESEGGFVRVAASLDEHLTQLREVLAKRPDPALIRRRVQEFIRPLGWDVPASTALLDAIERLAASDRESVTRAMPPVSRAVAPPPLAPAAHADVIRVISGRLSAGEIFYDAGAGTGAVAVAVARARGVTVYAFESSLVSIGAIWEYVLREGCDGAVVPMPLLPGARTTLRQESLASAAAGAARSTPRRHRWREHESSWSGEITQPVLAMPLDQTMKTWDLPAPHALRIALGDATLECLEGAKTLIASPTLRTIVIEGAGQAGADALLNSAQWTADDSLRHLNVSIWTRP